MIPAMTPQVVRERMDEVMMQARLAWNLRCYNTMRDRLEEFDYLSHWQTEDCNV